MSKIVAVFLIVLGVACLPIPFALAEESAGDSAAPAHAAAGDSVGLRLNDVLRRTIERNPSIAAARAAWDGSRAQALQAGALEDPMLELMAAPRSLGSSAVDPAYRVALNQPLPIFGQRGLRARVAREESRVAGFDLRTMQLDLIRDARMTYFEYWRIVRAADLTRELLALMGEFRRATLAKYGAGQVGQQDPLQADAEIAMLDHQLVILERERRVAVARLNVLMHDPPEQSLAPPPRELPVPDTVFVHRDLVPHARALRPELQAADAMVEASRANLSLARREQFPTTSFGLAYDRFWTEPELRPSVSVTLSLPINLGRVAAARDEASARLTRSEAEREAIDDSIAFQVEEAAARLHESAHDLSISRDRLVPLAGRTVHAARAGYEANRSDFLTLLNSVRDLLRAHLEADASFAMLHEARADLDRALGEASDVLKKEEQP